ncbi:MAG: Thiol:disulfide interchange protein DsbC [Firmicutes bacterium]|nr:Thiol:disulfide interchange protein DsbC [Bacillota bacterium]
MRHLLAATFVTLPLLATAQTTAGIGQDAAIRAAVKDINPTAEISWIRATPIAGVREVNSEGNIVYFTTDGRFLISGEIIDLRTRANHTEESRASHRSVVLRDAPASERIVFKAPNEKVRVLVFTDTSCSFSVKLHQRMAEYNRLGITIEYLAWPRAGINSGDFVKMRNIWCAADRNKAFDDTIAGRPVPAVNCNSPIPNQIALGQQIGVEGTPAIYGQSGIHIGGFLEPQQMAQALGLR